MVWAQRVVLRKRDWLKRPGKRDGVEGDWTRAFTEPLPPHRRTVFRSHIPQQRSNHARGPVLGVVLCRPLCEDAPAPSRA